MSEPNNPLPPGTEDLDEPDVNALHAAFYREKKEPTEGKEPVPRWMAAGFILLIAWGGWYLGRYDGLFDTQRSDMQPIAGAVVASDAPADPAGAGGVDLQRGGELYAGRCAACHQATGLGLPGLAPPIDGTQWATGDPDRMVKIVLHGLAGPITVKGVEWNSAMPPWGPSMTDDEISAVISYVRTSWSNDASHVTTADVTRVRDASDRSTPWTVEEL